MSAIVDDLIRGCVPQDSEVGVRHVMTISYQPFMGTTAHNLKGGPSLNTKQYGISLIW